MNKILKILSILVIGFVMFSCSTPTNDSTNPVEETPEVPTYSITFTIEKLSYQPIVDYLNSLSEFKNLEEGAEVNLLECIYGNSDASEFTKEEVVDSKIKITFHYEDEISLVEIGNEDVEVKIDYAEVVTYR